MDADFLTSRRVGYEEWAESIARSADIVTSPGPWTRSARAAATPVDS